MTRAFLTCFHCVFEKIAKQNQERQLDTFQNYKISRRLGAHQRFQNHYDEVLFNSFPIASESSSALYSTPKHFTTSMFGFIKYLHVFKIHNPLLSSRQKRKLKNQKKRKQWRSSGFTCYEKCRRDNHLLLLQLSGNKHGTLVPSVL